MLPRQHTNETWLMQFQQRFQLFLSAVPRVNLLGYEAVVRARPRSCWSRIWTIFSLIIQNKSQAPLIIIMLLCFGLGTVIGFLCFLGLFLQRQMQISIHQSLIMIVFLSGLIGFGFSMLFSLFNDAWIILVTVIGAVLWSSACRRLPLNPLQIYHSPLVISFLYILNYFFSTILHVLNSDWAFQFLCVFVKYLWWNLGFYILYEA